MTFLASLWRRASGLGAVLGAGLAIVFAAWLKGRQDGKAAIKLEQEERRAEAREVRKGIDDEVDGLGHADLDHRMARWLRR